MARRRHHLAQRRLPGQVLDRAGLARPHGARGARLPARRRSRRRRRVAAASAAAARRCRDPPRLRAAGADRGRPLRRLRQRLRGLRALRPARSRGRLRAAGAGRRGGGGAGAAAGTLYRAPGPARRLSHPPPGEHRDALGLDPVPLPVGAGGGRPGGGPLHGLVVAGVGGSGRRGAVGGAVVHVRLGARRRGRGGALPAAPRRPFPVPARARRRPRRAGRLASPVAPPRHGPSGGLDRGLHRGPADLHAGADGWLRRRLAGHTGAAGGALPGGGAARGAVRCPGGGGGPAHGARRCRLAPASHHHPARALLLHRGAWLRPRPRPHRAARAGAVPDHDGDYGGLAGGGRLRRPVGGAPAAALGRGLGGDAGDPAGAGVLAHPGLRGRPGLGRGGAGGGRDRRGGGGARRALPRP